jgi:tRNA threonylcarbamoyladenosine biosynthesis protein TsaE
MAADLRILTKTPEETQAVGRVLGESAQPGDIFLLTGTLGAGKTCLTQGIAWGLDVVEYARSPTFVIMTRYQGRMPVYHFDLYRINDSQEAWDLGLEEQLFGEGVCVVEWANRAADIFPENSQWIDLDYGDEESHRIITVKSPSSPLRLAMSQLPGLVSAVDEVGD